jgi:tetratricopeptide (TPR) repeat protein
MGERFGEDAVVRLLAAYDRGVPESRAIPEVLGVSADAFYRSFLAWARDEVRSWGLAPEPSMQELFAELRERDPLQSAAYREALADALEATVDELADQIGVPGDRRTQQLPGDAWPRPRTGPVEIDAAQLGEWLARHPNHPDLLEAAIRRAMRTLGEDASTPLDDATRDLIERYMKARPVDPYPHRILARRALASATPTDAIPHLAELDVREEHDNAFAIELAKLHRARGDRAAARGAAERAVRMDPYNPAIRELAAAIAVEAGSLEAARVHLVALKALEPGQQRHEQRLKRLDELLAR